MVDDVSNWELTPHFAWRRELFHGAILGLAVVVVLLAQQRFDPDFALVDDDAVSSWQPIFTDFTRQLGEGHMPVWSHHTMCGYPLLGWSQPSFVYPPMWVAHAVCRLIGFEAGEFFVATLMHAFLAALASFVYLRRFDVHPLAAATGALAASLSGILFGLGSCWPTYIFTAAYWPMVFLAIEEIRGRPSWFWTLVLGLLGGLAFLYADLMLMVKFSMLAGLYFLLRLDRRTAWASLRSVAIASGIALAIGVGQWYPSAEIILTSARMGVGGNDHYTAPPLLWLGFLFPFQTLPWESHFFSATRAAGGFFVGPCALLGLAFAVRWYRPLDGPHRALAPLVLLYGVLALGNLFSPNDWIQKLPVMNAIRWPFRWMFEVSCILALLSGFGLNLTRRDLASGHGRAIVVVFVGVMGFALLMRWPPPPYMNALSVMMLAVWVIGLAGLWQFATRETADQFLGVVLGWTAIAMVANLPVAQETRMARLTHLVDDPLAVGRDSSDRVLFLARHTELKEVQRQGDLSRCFPHRFGTRSVLGYAYRPPSQAWMTGFELDGLIYEHEPDLARRFLDDSKILSTLRVGFVVVNRKNEVLMKACDRHRSLTRTDQTDFYNVYRHEGFKRPAFLVKTLQREKEADDIIDLGLRVAMPETALVEPGYTGLMSFTGAGTVRDFDEHHDRVRMSVDSPDEGFLVVTTTYFPRWRATVDGAPTPLVRVNGSFLGLRVPAGTHDVELRYQPTDHLVMLVVSAAALIATCLGCVWIGRRSV